MLFVLKLPGKLESKQFAYLCNTTKFSAFIAPHIQQPLKYCSDYWCWERSWALTLFVLLFPYHDYVLKSYCSACCPLTPVPIPSHPAFDFNVNWYLRNFRSHRLMIFTIGKWYSGCFPVALLEFCIFLESYPKPNETGGKNFPTALWTASL